MVGWDTEDPSLVLPEFNVSGGYADYALLEGAKPVIVVEAKKLGSSLDAAVDQGINYCIKDALPYFAATDGRHWRIYETHKPVPLAQKLIVQLDVLESPADTCRAALAFWRHGVAETRSVVAPARALMPDTIAVARTLPVAKPPTVPLRNDLQRDGTETSGPARWVSFADLVDVLKDHRRPPIEIKFPDRARRVIKHWYEPVTETVRWLSIAGLLVTPRLALARGRRYVFAEVPEHPNGKEFRSPKFVEGVFVEAHNNVIQHVANALLIIESVGQDPAQFFVRFDD